MITEGGDMHDNRVVTVITYIIGIPLAICLMVWVGWITVTAFVGGQAPFFFMNFEGFSLLRGLLWLVIIDPIVLTIAYWIFMLIMFPIAGGVAGVSMVARRFTNDRK
jgi:hypothetical protein